MKPENPVRPGLALPRVSLGAMTFGDPVTEHEARAMLDMALEEGANLVDTANGYAHGASEEIVGRLLRGRRDEVLIATKVGNPGVADGPPLGPAEIRRWITHSLQQLLTDHVDIYYLHRPDPTTPLEETLGAMHELVSEGLVRHIGVSNHAAWQLTRMHWIAEREGASPVGVSQPVYHLLARRIEDEYVSCTEALDIRNVVYNPLAGGLLTGKHVAGTAPAPGTRFAEKAHYHRRYWNDAQFAAVDALAGVARDAGITLTQLAFRWLLSQPHVASVLVGASRPEQLRENLDACRGGPLPGDVLERCDEVWDRLRGAAPSYTK